MSNFSRNEAEKLINQKKVKVNGEVINSATFFVTKEDKIIIEGVKPDKIATKIKDISIIALNKPRGLVVTRKDEKNRKTIYSILPSQYANYIYIGRLDMQSEGLILLTNSGDLAHAMESPKNEFEREYEVRVFGYLTPDKINRMTKGVSIDGLLYKAKSVTIKKRKGEDSANTWLSIVLVTGKNREVRKLMEFFNLSVNRLVRVRYGNVLLNASMPVGSYMPLHRTKLAKILTEVSQKCGKDFNI